MVKRIPAVAIALALSFLSTAQEKWTIPGLQQEVEILVDQWGIPHIYFWCRSFTVAAYSFSPITFTLSSGSFW